MMWQLNHFASTSKFGQTDQGVRVSGCSPTSKIDQPSSWWTFPVSGGRPAWCGTSTAGVVRKSHAPRDRGSPREELRIGAPRQAMSDRACRWITEQVGRYARSVNEIAIEQTVFMIISVLIASLYCSSPR